MTLDSALTGGWCLAVFPERYGGGGRALIAADMNVAALVEGELTGGDIGAVEMA